MFMDSFIQDIERHVIHHLQTELHFKYTYHNLPHTQRVVNAVKEIIEVVDIEASDASKLLAATWFHDVGYTISDTNHEEKSVDLATSYLQNKGCDASFIADVAQLIRATQMSYAPQNELEAYIKDADCAHFSDKNYIEISELLRYEWSQTQDKTFTDKEWLAENIQFFTQHHRYYSTYANDHWQSGKDKNLAQLLKLFQKQKLEENKTKKRAEELKLKKNKAKLPERGIETMFRVTLRNHITLSDIADTKANILLSVNAIIVSLALSNLIPKLDNASNEHLIIPTVIFILFTTASMILSVLATRPNVTSGKFSRQDVEDKKVNLLFFGNFHKMKLADFEWAMNELMKDKDYLYNSMTKDLYFLGKVLDKKYKILRVTYTVFIIGIVISILAFGISFKMNGIH